jgi:hypothetical protein
MKNTLEQSDKRLKSRRTIFAGPERHIARMAAALADMGFSTKIINENTGLSPSQIAYRLKFAEVHRAGKDKKTGKPYPTYRNGQSLGARLVLNKVLAKVEEGISVRIDHKLEAEQRERFASHASPPPKVNERK